MKSKKNVIDIIKILKSTYPDAKCSLDFSTPFEMLVAVVLSAQCTDERVNKVTPTIFAQYSTPEDFANMDISHLESLIHSCGFYKTKAKNIKSAAEMIVSKYNGIVPNDPKKLVSLPGVGQKSMNVIMLEAFNQPQGIAVDTHVSRISNRIGLSDKKDPSKIELDLLKEIPSMYYKDVNHVFIWHGRNICKSQSPKCDICPINKYCDYYKVFSKE